MPDRPRPTYGLLRVCSAVAASLLMALAAPDLGAQQRADGDVGAPITDFAAVQRSKVYRAERTADAIEIDGVADEAAWSRAAVGSGFYQTDPQSGVPATEEKTSPAAPAWRRVRREVLTPAPGRARRGRSLFASRRRPPT